MMKNERGGVICKIIAIPVGIALVAGFFYLGYSVGQYRHKVDALGENTASFPEIVAKTLSRPEEFTFFKTLTDKGDKTVSIELKPKPAQGVNNPEKLHSEAETLKQIPAQPSPSEKQKEVKIEKETVAPVKPVQVASQRPQAQARKETAPVVSRITLRYTLQIASYQEKNMAEDDVKKMKKHGYAAFIVSSELPGKGKWHRVRIGSLSNRAAAEKLQKDIHAKVGISPVITIE